MAKRRYKVVHRGDLLSMNERLSMKWGDYTPKLKKLKWKLKQQIIRAKAPRLETFSLQVRFNSKQDVDNVWLTCKVFVDLLRAMNKVPEDYNQFYKSVCVEFDQNLPRNTIIFEVCEPESTS